MKKTIAAWTILMCGLTIQAGATPVTISNPFVTMTDGTIFNSAVVGWGTLPVLQAGETLVLAQDGPGVGEDINTGFDFDGSDHPGGPAKLTMTINGVPGTILDSNCILSAGCNDGGGLNEMHDWVNSGITGIPNLRIFFGYADNVHPGGVCSTATCLPSLFQNATYFLAAPSVIEAGGLNALYWDSSAILFVNTSLPDFHPVPEPATLVMLGTGLLVVARRVRRVRS